jgi:uncharacterized membrane protein YqhA
VVAITARPISLVPWIAAVNGGTFFSSMKRKIFSSTIMASSITMPTIRVSASMVMLFSVKPMAAISAKVEMMDVGMATAAISVVRMFARKMKMMMAAKNAAFDQVVLESSPPKP